MDSDPATGGGAARRVAEGLADLLDGLHEDFSVEGFAARVTRCCVTIFEVAAVGLSLAERDGRLSAVASSSTPARVLEAAAAHYRQGPGPDSYLGNVPVPNTSLRNGRWPQLASFAGAQRIDTACSVPVRDGARVLGALSLYQVRGQHPAPDLVVVRAVAKVAGTWLERGRDLERSVILAGQLQQALTSRVVIEQAKGMLAERWQVTPDEAFTPLRRHARVNRRPLHVLAHEIVTGDVELSPPG